MAAFNSPEMPIVRRKTYELVADRLVELIGTQALGAGDALPTERELSSRYGVGRSSIREALRMLESQGVIEPASSGAFVIASSSNPLGSSLRLLMTLQGQRMHEIFELRRILECEAVALAAERREQRHLDEMEAAIEAMVAGLAGTDGADYIDADVRFHVAIAEATANSLVALTMYAVRDILRQALASIFLIPDAAAGSVPEHRAIHSAIEARDPVRARAEMAAHLRRVEGTVTRSVDG